LRLPHVVPLEIAEQPHGIAAEGRIVLQPGLAHVLREVDRREAVEGEIGLFSTIIGTWQPAQPKSWNCRRPSWKSYAKLVVVGGSSDSDAAGAGDPGSAAG
jgi:hypothetical protein